MDGLEFQKKSTDLGAKTQYATNGIYLCNTVMIFDTLRRLGTQAELLLMHKSSFQIEDQPGIDESPESKLLRKARDELGVILQPIEVQKRQGGDRR